MWIGFYNVIKNLETGNSIKIERVPKMYKERYDPTANYEIRIDDGKHTNFAYDTNMIETFSTFEEAKIAFEKLKNELCREDFIINDNGKIPFFLEN